MNMCALFQSLRSGIQRAGSASRLALLATALGTLCACSGGGSSSSSDDDGGGGGGGGTPSVVSGTAATGAPVAGATITLKDASGNTATATTASDGTFQIDVTNLTAPFLLSVSSGGTTLYSYASASGTTANLTPYTSVTLQSYYLALGSDIATVFGSTLDSSSFPSSQQLTLLADSVVRILQPYLISADVSDPSQFDLFTAVFIADHSGFDQILDRTVVDGNLDSFTVDNGSGSTAGSISSSVSVTATTSSGASTTANVSFSTTTTDSESGSSSTSTQSTPVGSTPTQQSRLDSAQTGVLALFSSLASTAASKGASFSLDDALTFIDPAYLDEGDDRDELANELVEFITSLPEGATITASIERVNSFIDNSDTDQTINVTVHLVVQSGDTTMNEYLTSNDDLSSGAAYRLDSSGNWKFYGNRSFAQAHVNIQATRFYDPNTSSSATDSLVIQGQLSADQALALTSVALSSSTNNSLPDCTSYMNGTPVPMTNNAVTMMQDSGIFNGNDVRFDLPCTNMPGQSSPASITSDDVPPAGTVYTFTLSTAAGTLGTQTSALNGATTEVGDIATINGTARATFVNSNTVTSVTGTQLTIGFTPPVTFPLLYSFISAFCKNAAQVSSGGGSDFEGDDNQIPPGTNTGTITIPSQCDGDSPASLGVSVYFIGVNGERSQVTQNLSP